MENTPANRIDPEEYARWSDQYDRQPSTDELDEWENERAARAASE